MAGELDFDLVVLDLNLPQLDGVAILRFAAHPEAQYADSGADRAHPGEGPCFVPGPGRGRLSGEAVLLHRTVGSDPGPDAAQPHEQKLRLLPAGWLEHEEWMPARKKRKQDPWDLRGVDLPDARVSPRRSICVCASNGLLSSHCQRGLTGLELRDGRCIWQMCVDHKLKIASLLRDSLSVFGKQLSMRLPARAWTLAPTFHCYGRASRV